MKQTSLLTLLTLFVLKGYSQQKYNVMEKPTVSLTCKLTTPELQERKRTVIAAVKKLVAERTETVKGVQYKFNDSDETIDLLTNFIKTERLCCPFFRFDLVVGEVENFVYLELSGPEGTKDFIEHEIGF